jgi:hypothetical protein
MAITYNNVIKCLTNAVPEFHPDRQDVADNIVYLVFEDLVRFVKLLLEKEDQDGVLKRTFDVVEKALRDGDPRVVEMLRDTFSELALLDFDRIKHFMGPLSRKLLKKVRSDVYR